MVRLTLQRRLAAQIMKCAPEKVSFDDSKLNEVKESITKTDIKALVGSGVISCKHSPGSSRGNARKILQQKRKGLRKGYGSRKGTASARLDPKEKWMAKIRKQRDFLKELRNKELITTKVYGEMMRKAKGGFFRSKRHIGLYLNEHELIKAKTEKQE